MTSLIFVGVTIRPQAQPTAIVVTQMDYAYDRTTRKRQDFFTVRFLELIAARTPYRKIAYRLKQVIDNLHIQAAQYKARVILYVDVTGLGDSIIDLLKARVDPLIPCYLNGSDKRLEHRDSVTMGKAWMVARLQTLLQGGRIMIQETPATDLLIEELLAYELDPNPRDNALTSSFTIGSQDQMVTALGLACQGIPEREEAGEEYLDYMRRRVLLHIPRRHAPSADPLREWSGQPAAPAVHPLTGQPLVPTPNHQSSGQLLVNQVR